MPELTFGAAAYTRNRGNFLEIPVINMISEQTPTEGTVSLISRPGLTPREVSYGTGPVKALYAKDGVFSGNLFVVASSAVYRENVPIGTITGSGPVSIAGFSDTVFFNAGRDIYKYDGSWGTVSFPDSARVRKIIVAASRLIAIRDDSEMFYWSDPLTDTIDGLSFASAESSPDGLKDMLYVGSTLVLFGDDTTELWQTTTNSDLPFQPLVGRTFELGIKQTGAVAKLTSSFVWVTNRNTVCFGSPENIISYAGLEEKIYASETVSLFNFWLDGLELLALRLDTETWIYNFREQSWTKFQSNQDTNWLPCCAVGSVFGSSASGVVLDWATNYIDNGEELERRFIAWAPTTAGSTKLNNVIVRANPGNTPFLDGQYADPVIEMRMSRDGGRTWSAWIPKSLGEQGKYRTQLIWYSCGVFSYPGVVLEFRVTDPVPFRVSQVMINESVKGI